VKKIFVVILLIFILPSSLYPEEKNSKSDKWEELFHKANQFYKDGNFENALNTYLEIASSGHVSGDLYYNMGNACFRLKMTGHAILYYERARAFIPRDADLDFNLKYVRKLAKDEIEISADIITSIFFWTAYMTHKELFLLFAVVNLIAWSALALRLYLKKEWTYYLFIIFLAAWFITGASFTWKYYISLSDNRAVILSEEADVLSGPDSGDKLLFQVHAGTVVYLKDTEDKWKLINLPDNKRGWIKADTLESIRQK
jgi:tetratricopeptide (TPR) repeat protein